MLTVLWCDFHIFYSLVYSVACLSQLIQAHRNQFRTSALDASFSDILLITWNQPSQEYLHKRKYQVLGIKPTPALASINCLAPSYRYPKHLGQCLTWWLLIFIKGINGKMNIVHFITATNITIRKYMSIESVLGVALLKEEPSKELPLRKILPIKLIM